MTPQALLFDLDGTLTDSIDLIVHCYQRTVKEFIGQELTREEVVPAIGCSLYALFAALSADRWPQMVLAYRTEYARLADDWVTLYPGVTEVFDMLERKNIPIAVVTSKGTDSALPALARFGLDERLALLVTADDTTDHKPHPAPLLLAAERLALSPDTCWYVGDSTHDMVAARAAGMRAIAALWGPTSREELSPLSDDLLENPALLGTLLS
jgi:pyrophosphatase PpaX